MEYTVHAGHRGDEWPAQVATAATRGEAQALARAALAAAPPDVTKAEVRLRVVLLDAYSKRPSGTIRPVYAALQRVSAKEAAAAIAAIIRAAGDAVRQRAEARRMAQRVAQRLTGPPTDVELAQMDGLFL